jgi:hypothetical protein
MITCLWKPLFDFLRHLSPFSKGDLHCLGIFTPLKSEVAEKVDEVISDVILDGGAVTNGIYGAQRSADKAEVGVSFESVFVSLSRKFFGDVFAELCLGWKLGINIFFEKSK